jgi:hypothetical protein
MDLTSRLKERPSGPTTKVEPGDGTTSGYPCLEEDERVEPEFPIVAVGPEEVPFPIHPAVGDNR